MVPDFSVACLIKVFQYHCPFLMENRMCLESSAYNFKNQCEIKETV